MIPRRPHLAGMALGAVTRSPGHAAYAAPVAHQSLDQMMQFRQAVRAEARVAKLTRQLGLQDARALQAQQARAWAARQAQLRHAGFSGASVQPSSILAPSAPSTPSSASAPSTPSTPSSASTAPAPAVVTILYKIRDAERLARIVIMAWPGPTPPPAGQSLLDKLASARALAASETANPPGSLSTARALIAKLGHARQAAKNMIGAWPGPTSPPTEILDALKVTIRLAAADVQAKQHKPIKAPPEHYEGTGPSALSACTTATVAPDGSTTACTTANGGTMVLGPGASWRHCRSRFEGCSTRFPLSPMPTRWAPWPPPRRRCTS